jgi:hypothetical protein
MDQVNWVEDAEYLETHSPALNLLYKEMYNNVYGKKLILLHDMETSNDQPDNLLRVLDDSPEKEWEEFFKYDLGDEQHTGYRKTQADGRLLIKIDEIYLGAGVSMPCPMYFLIMA